MLGRDETLIALTVPCAPTAPAVVREELSHFDELGWVLGDVMLVASELVNNAVVHSGCTSHHDLQVRASRRASRLTLSVRDPGLSGSPARLTQPSERQKGGWGLRLIEQLCESWGEERDDGYCVWADINLPTGERQEESP
jgi:anti-sigma regulatory factor (Ser/Thr protein kinase)